MDNLQYVTDIILGYKITYEKSYAHECINF